MVGKRENFFIPSSRVLLWSATFIMLSGTIPTPCDKDDINKIDCTYIGVYFVASAERQCYWCGPLAEQVHRSRRAPPCDLPTGHVTTCEPGLMHCAIVATAPPHVESRFCVKLYQDECYPLFCNSTRTWKMTCPCRGDLCNGNNTEREHEAFAVLSKLAARSQNVRIKKRAATDSASFGQERTIIITNVTELSNQTDDGTNGAREGGSMIVVTSTIQGDSIKEEPGINTPTKKTLKENSIGEIHDEPKQSQLDIDHDTTTMENSGESTTSIPKADSDETDAPTASSEADEIEVTASAAGIAKGIETTKISEIVNGISPTRETEVEADAIKELDGPIAKKTVIPSEQLPTAEALQQNAGPTATSSKPTENIKAETTELISTVEAENNATEQSKAVAASIVPIPTHFVLIAFINYLTANRY